MELDSFIFSALLLLTVAAVMVALFKRLGLGSVLGLLVAGADLAHPKTPESSLHLGAEVLKSLGLRSRNDNGVLSSDREEEYAPVREDVEKSG